MKNKKLANLVSCALFAAIICVLAPWSIPLTVPITAATFAVYVSGGVLGVKRAWVSVLLYIVIGAVGVPVFSNFRGGISALVGPTGGYIIGYLPCVLICAAFADLAFRHKLGYVPSALIFAAGAVVGTAVLYAAGTTWYIIMTKTALPAAISACVIPFLPGDALKIAASAVLFFPLRKQLAGFGL